MKHRRIFYPAIIAVLVFATGCGTNDGLLPTGPFPSDHEKLTISDPDGFRYTLVTMCDHTHGNRIYFLNKSVGGITAVPDPSCKKK